MNDAYLDILLHEIDNYIFLSCSFAKVSPSTCQDISQNVQKRIKQYMMNNKLVISEKDK